MIERVAGIADPAGTVEHLKPAAAQRIEDFINSMPPTNGVYQGEPLDRSPDGIYISPATAHDGEELPRITGIDLLPGAQLGAADSHHEVCFADVALTEADEPTQKITRIAIKAFTSDSGQAEYEHDCLALVQKKGFDTFRPLALAKNGDTTYLITLWRGEVESLDNINWTIAPDDAARYEKEVLPTLTFIAENMADLHAKGIFHGDAAAKNFAKSDAGKPIVTDLETAMIAQDEDEQLLLITGGENFRDSRALADVAHFWYELTHPTKLEDTNIFLEGADFEKYLEVFDRDVLTPYVKRLEAQLTPELLLYVDIGELRSAIFDKVASYP